MINYRNYNIASRSANNLIVLFCSASKKKNKLINIYQSAICVPKNLSVRYMSKTFRNIPELTNYIEINNIIKNENELSKYSKNEILLEKFKKIPKLTFNQIIFYDNEQVELENKQKKVEHKIIDLMDKVTETIDINDLINLIKNYNILYKELPLFSDISMDIFKVLNDDIDDKTNIIFASLTKPFNSNSSNSKFNPNEKIKNIAVKILRTKDKNLLNLDYPTKMFTNINPFINKEFNDMFEFNLEHEAINNNKLKYINNTNKECLIICIIDDLNHPSPKIRSNGIVSYFSKDDENIYNDINYNNDVKFDNKFMVSLVTYDKFFWGEFYKNHIANNKYIPYNTVFIFINKNWQEILYLFNKQGFNLSGGNSTLRHLQSPNEFILGNYFSVYPFKYIESLHRLSIKKDNNIRKKLKNFFLKSESSIIKNINEIYNILNYTWKHNYKNFEQNAQKDFVKNSIDNLLSCLKCHNKLIKKFKEIEESSFNSVINKNNNIYQLIKERNKNNIDINKILYSMSFFIYKEDKRIDEKIIKFTKGKEFDFIKYFQAKK